MNKKVKCCLVSLMILVWVIKQSSNHTRYQNSFCSDWRKPTWSGFSRPAKRKKAKLVRVPGSNIELLFSFELPVFSFWSSWRAIELKPKSSWSWSCNWPLQPEMIGSLDFQETVTQQRQLRKLFLVDRLHLTLIAKWNESIHDKLIKFEWLSTFWRKFLGFRWDCDCWQLLCHQGSWLIFTHHAKTLLGLVAVGKRKNDWASDPRRWTNLSW